MGPPQRWNLPPPLTSQPAPKLQCSVFPSVPPPPPSLEFDDFLCEHLAHCRAAAFRSHKRSPNRRSEFFPQLTDARAQPACPAVHCPHGETMSEPASFLSKGFSSLGWLLDTYLFLFKLPGKEERKSFHWDHLGLGKKNAVGRGRALWRNRARRDLGFSFFLLEISLGMKVKITHQLLEVLAGLTWVRTPRPLEISPHFPPRVWNSLHFLVKFILLLL